MHQDSTCSLCYRVRGLRIEWSYSFPHPCANSEKQRERASILNTLPPKTCHQIPAVFGPCSGFLFCHCENCYDQRRLGRKGSISSHLYNLSPMGAGQEPKMWACRGNQWRDAACGLSLPGLLRVSYTAQAQPPSGGSTHPQSTLFLGDSRFVSRWQLTLTVTWNNHYLHSSYNLWWYFLYLITFNSSCYV